MSFKSAITYDMNYIINELDNIETEELIEISENTNKFLNLLMLKIEYRKIVEGKREVICLEKNLKY